MAHLPAAPKSLDSLPLLNTQKKRVAYFYDSDVGNYAYGAGHPMKPHRIRMAHSLVMNYGLYKKMEIYRAKPATKQEMTQFHTDEYVDFLYRVTPENMDSFMKEQAKFNVGDDCPVFDGLFEFCSISGGGSMEGAARLNRGKCDIAINYAGGLHHAKKSEASGFCYVNDIVLGIIELLRYHPRVLYIDIDVHHGDGVEEAFYTTDRVMTCSFHKYGEYFPGTGELRDIGVGKGKNYAVNFPLRDGIDDLTYRSVFEPVISHIMEWYQPSAVVLQTGGDSLSGDRLGCFNLSMYGHASCVRFVKSFGLPTLVVGGGGYTMRNVARTWCFECGHLVGQEVGPEIPYNDYYEYYGPDYLLEVRPSNMQNANTPQYLNKILSQVLENVSRTKFVPSVQMHETPRDAPEVEPDEDAHIDERNGGQPGWDKTIQHDGDLSDSEDEGEGGRRNKTSHKNILYEEKSHIIGSHLGANDKNDHQKKKNDKSTQSTKDLNSKSIDNANSILTEGSSIPNTKQPISTLPSFNLNGNTQSFSSLAPFSNATVSHVISPLSLSAVSSASLSSSDSKEDKNIEEKNVEQEKPQEQDTDIIMQDVLPNTIEENDKIEIDSREADVKNNGKTEINSTIQIQSSTNEKDSLELHSSDSKIPSSHSSKNSGNNSPKNEISKEETGDISLPEIRNQKDNSNSTPVIMKDVKINTSHDAGKHISNNKDKDATITTNDDDDKDAMEL